MYMNYTFLHPPKTESTSKYTRTHSHTHIYTYTPLEHAIVYVHSYTVGKHSLIMFWRRKDNFDFWLIVHY